MRKWTAIAFATVLETVSDPLALLLTASALTLAVLSPRLHYHQFGEPSRMAREAGLSALLVFGLAYVVFGAVKAIRREIESGTIQMALSHPISRASFFTAKVAGVFASYMVIFITVFCASLAAVRGSEIGAEIASANGTLPLMWGPSFAFAFSALAVAPIVAAALNRFMGFRFVPTCAMCALAVSVASAFYRPDPALALRYLGAASALPFPAAVFVSVAGAAAARLKDHAAVSVSLFAILLSLPILGNYYIPNELTDGGSVSPGYLAMSFLAAMPLAAAALVAGVQLFKGRDMAE